MALEKAGRNFPKKNSSILLLREQVWNELDIKAQEVARKMMVSCMKGGRSIMS